MARNRECCGIVAGSMLRSTVGIRRMKFDVLGSVVGSVLCGVECGGKCGQECIAKCSGDCGGSRGCGRSRVCSEEYGMCQGVSVAQSIMLYGQFLLTKLTNYL